MKPQIYECDYYVVETSCGSEIVPQDVAGDVETVGDLLDYLKGRPESDDFERKTGWVGRMRLPGFLDATDWTAGQTFESVALELEELYGE